MGNMFLGASGNLLSRSGHHSTICAWKRTVPHQTTAPFVTAERTASQTCPEPPAAATRLRMWGSLVGCTDQYSFPCTYGDQNRWNQSIQWNQSIHMPAYTAKRVTDLCLTDSTDYGQCRKIAHCDAVSQRIGYPGVTNGKPVHSNHFSIV